MYAKWVPFDANNQFKLEQTLNLGGTFVDIEDSNFPKVKRVRVFPKSNYLSYLGVKYRLSRVMQPDAWSDSHDMTSTPTSTTTQIQQQQQQQCPSPLLQHQPIIFNNETQQTLSRLLPPPPPFSPPTATTTTTTTTSTSSTQTTRMDYWRSSPHRSSQTLISHVLS
ncbi:hypothetical protein BCR42DRAFT_415760 [Absidia repens]|uniref:Uncharacterized protein n=1 Tax=Absidia repens TaxID=90262 RepID=A0A1X2IFM5_9FUNG|nr:hypothetical protein BCR42DRAFT_415760 [Absidia repens]